MLASAKSTKESRQAPTRSPAFVLEHRKVSTSKAGLCLLSFVDLKKVEYKKIGKRKASPFGLANLLMLNSAYSKTKPKSSWTQVPNKILDDPFLSCQEKMVLVILHRYAFKKNNCYPSVPTIAKMANIRVQNVYKILKILAGKRFIKKHLRPGFATIYELTRFGE